MPSSIYVTIGPVPEALDHMTGYITEIQELTKGRNSVDPIDFKSYKKISENLRITIGYIEMLEVVYKNEEEDKKKAETKFEEESAAMAHRIKEMETKMDEERAAMATQINEMKSKHDEDIKALNKELTITKDNLLAEKVKMYNAEANINAAKEQLNYKPIYVPPPHVKKASAITNGTIQKELDAVTAERDVIIAKLDAAQAEITSKTNELAAAKAEINSHKKDLAAANAAFTAKSEELDAYRKYNASLNDDFCKQLYDAQLQLQELGVEKQIAQYTLQQEQQNAAAFLLELEDTKKQLAREREACDGTTGCTSCMQHLRVALRVSQAHEAEAGRRCDAMWIAQLRAMEDLASARSGLPPAEVEGAEEEGVQVVTPEEQDSGSDSDDGDFEIITGC